MKHRFLTILILLCIAAAVVMCFTSCSNFLKPTQTSPVTEAVRAREQMVLTPSGALMTRRDAQTAQSNEFWH